MVGKSGTARKQGHRCVITLLTPWAEEDGRFSVSRVGQMEMSGMGGRVWRTMWGDISLHLELNIGGSGPDQTTRNLLLEETLQKGDSYHLMWKIHVRSLPLKINTWIGTMKEKDWHQTIGCLPHESWDEASQLAGNDPSTFGVAHKLKLTK